MALATGNGSTDNKEKKMATENTESFKQHYQNLKSIAETMRTQQEPDIDQLIPQVDSALKSYSVCKERLDAVKKMLDERFGQEQQ